MTPRRWVCAGIFAGTLALATPAWSQTYVGVPPPTVLGERFTRTEATTPVPPKVSNIAYTGADIAEMVAIGALVMSAGALSVRVGRARPIGEGVNTP